MRPTPFPSQPSDLKAGLGCTPETRAWRHCQALGVWFSPCGGFRQPGSCFHAATRISRLPARALLSAESAHLAGGRVAHPVRALTPGLKRREVSDRVRSSMSAGISDSAGPVAAALAIATRQTAHAAPATGAIETSPKQACLEHLRAGESNRSQDARSRAAGALPPGVPLRSVKQWIRGRRESRRIVWLMELDEATAAVHAARA
jgi:hypothetical protein